MSKKIKLSINEPCHENWENMTPVQQGKFCGSCQKQVVDFSLMSDNQIAEFFKKPSTGSVCGRFMNDQLDRDIDIPKKRIPWFKYFFTIALPVFFMSKAGAQRTMGTVYRPVEKKDTTAKPVQEFMGKVSPVIQPVCIKDTDRMTVKGEISLVERPAKDIKGMITDEKGDPVYAASVYNISTGMQIFSDKLGKFSLKAKTGDVLSISAPGYKNQELTIGNANWVSAALSPMEKEPVIIVAGMISIDRRPTKQEPLPVIDTTERIVEDVDNLEFPDNYSNDEIEGKIISMIQSDELPNNSSLKIFPNPVSGGNKISVECKKLDPGTYRLQWFDQKGQAIKQEEINTDNKSNFIQTNVPNISAGTYYMILTERKTGKRFSQKIVIQ